MSEKVEQVPVDLIDDPVIAMRTTIDEEKLDELARSIAVHGLIQPVTLRKEGDRYEVVAGHRRTVAAKRAGLEHVSAVVRELTEERADELKVHENLFREDVNPVDEARFIVRMIDAHGKDAKEMARMCGKSVEYVRARYELLHYSDYLVEAVERGHMSMSAAQWLSKITDDVVRREYTRFAKLGGITATRAHAWYSSWKAGSLPPQLTQEEMQQEATAAEPAKLTAPCAICQFEDDVTAMQLRYVHADCEKATRRVVEEASEREREALAQASGEAASQEEATEESS